MLQQISKEQYSCDTCIWMQRHKKSTFWHYLLTREKTVPCSPFCRLTRRQVDPMTDVCSRYTQGL